MGILSVVINRAVLWWGSPAGVTLSVIVCTVGHIALTRIGYLKTPADHYIAALSELALVGTAAILHAGTVSTKAIQIKLDGLIRGIEGVSDSLTEIEELPEGELDTLRSDLRGD
jgi:low affinity Fe/Cu permease